jgi:protein tyrosine phosphatase (PTP) superfamily phosphohydrolase (DUF442 family)
MTAVNTERKSHFKLNRKAMISLTLAGVFVALVLTVYRMSVFRPSQNFHVVDEGRFYRSAQLTGPEFEEVVKQFGIKSVINLRGAQAGEPWFDAEKSTLEKLGVQLINFGFSTEHLPSASDLNGYLDALEKLPRPILVHCRSGADRTGEASSIYAMEYMGQPREQALSQLSFTYLHVPFFQPSKRFLINHYGGRAWAKTTYNPCSPEFIKYASGYDCPNAPRTKSFGEIFGYHTED